MGGIVHQTFVGGHYTALLFKVLGAELCTFVGFVVYWMILYPRYFTPFRVISTPSVRIVLFALHRRQANNKVASNNFDRKLPCPLPR